jgi:hypothetical protein
LAGLLLLWMTMGPLLPMLPASAFTTPFAVMALAFALYFARYALCCPNLHCDCGGCCQRCGPLCETLRRSVMGHTTDLFHHFEPPVTRTGALIALCLGLCALLSGLRLDGFHAVSWFAAMTPLVVVHSGFVLFAIAMTIGQCCDDEWSSSRQRCACELYTFSGALHVCFAVFEMLLARWLESGMTDPFQGVARWLLIPFAMVLGTCILAAMCALARELKLV